MKTLLIGLTFLMASAFTTHPGKPVSKKFFSYYDVQLVSTEATGMNYDWTWKVTNPDPGNGKDGSTLQDLSHWGLVMPSCVSQSDIVSAAYSSDGITWNNLPATIAVDPSQTCYTAPILKFNVGFPGTTQMYYRLTVNKPFNTGVQPAVFKSGRYTGCYVGMVAGISCDDGGVIR